jgi:hypothetical protein
MPSAYDLYTFYLKPEDLRGQAHTLIIEAVREGEVYNPRARVKEKVLVVTFVGKKKTMALNKTQVGALIDITGTDDYLRWAGVRVVVSAAIASNKKETIAFAAAPAPAAPAASS